MNQVAARLFVDLDPPEARQQIPQLDLPELILEMHARTGLGAAFTHASEGNARAEDMATTICAVLVAEATNTGFEPLVVPRCPRCAGLV